jgi:hypothetical protein
MKMRDHELFKIIVDADIATSHIHPENNQHLVQGFIRKFKTHIPAALHTQMDIAVSLTNMGLGATNRGHYKEAQGWFSLAWQSSKSSNKALNAALTSWTASAEAYLQWRKNDYQAARANTIKAMNNDLYLEQEHDWKFLMPHRLHLTHLVARAYFSEGNFHQGMQHSIPGNNSLSAIPTSAEISKAANESSENRKHLMTAISRMAGEIIINGSLYHAARISDYFPLIKERTTSSPSAGIFDEVVELFTSATENSTEILIRKGRGKTIAWYAAVFNAQRQIESQDIRKAIAVRASKWTDIPTEIRQALLSAI